MLPYSQSKLGEHEASGRSTRRGHNWVDRKAGVVRMSAIMLDIEILSDCGHCYY